MPDNIENKHNDNIGALPQVYQPTKFIRPKYQLTEEHRAKLRANMAKARANRKINKIGNIQDIKDLSVDTIDKGLIDNNLNSVSNELQAVEGLNNGVLGDKEGLNIRHDSIIVSKNILRALKKTDWNKEKPKDAAGVYMVLNNAQKEHESKPVNNNIRVYQYYEVKPEEVKPTLEAEESQTVSLDASIKE